MFAKRECEVEPWDGDGIDMNIPECTHPEHWQASPDDGSGWFDWDDPVAHCRWMQTHQNCDLDAGHDGPHHWPGLTVRVPMADDAGIVIEHYKFR